MDELFTVRAATPGDAEALRVFAAAQGNAAAQLLERHWRQPRARPTLTRLVERADSLAGYALLAHRRLRLGTATIEAGVIDALVAQGDAKQREALLGDCLGTLFDEGLPLAMLSGSAAQLGDYGFALYQLRTHIELPVLAMLPSPARPLRATTAEDASELAALYSASYATIPLGTQRAAPDWRAWLEEIPALALEDAHGRVLAYAAPARGTSFAEAAAADAGIARALLGALAARAGTPVLLALPHRHPVAQAALQLGGCVTARAYTLHEEAPLAGVVDLAGLLSQLAPELERRLARSRYAGWQGSVRFELAGERITLMVAERGIVVADGTRPADVRLRQMSLAALPQLCLGYRTAADLRATGEMACDDAELGLIDVLFPAL